MNKIIIILTCVFAGFYQIKSQATYNWPCIPFNQQHYINGTFCENRPKGDIAIHHFHDGLDIHLPQGNNVYSVINGTVTYLSTVGINAYIRVGRYAYVHVDPNPALQVGSSVTAFQTVIGTTNSYNHIHFKDGYSGYEIDALRAGSGISPLNDPYLPSIDWVKYYINGTTTQFSNNRVSGLVEIVAKARDRTDNGSLGDNNGIFSIGYQIYDESGTISLSDSIQNFVFMQIPPSDSYVTNVFFTGSDISNYYYTITNEITRDGYWDTRSLEPGIYKVKVFTQDSKLNRNTIWSTVEVVAQDIYPPAIPELSNLIGDNNNQWTLRWLPNDSLDIGGYHLYFSDDAEKWGYQSSISDQLTGGDTTLSWDNFPDNATIYFKLKAYDDNSAPNFSDFSDAYGVRLSTGGPDILVVDGFDRIDGYWNESFHQYNLTYGAILSDLNIAFNSVSDDAVVSNFVDLAEYQNVIYFLGDEAVNPKTLSREEQSAISAYLNQGGNLIISGSEIGYDLVLNGSEPDSVFFADYLKANLVSDSSSSLTIEGAGDSPLAGFITEIVPPAGTVVRPDVIIANNSQPILYFSDGGVAGVFYNGIFGQGSQEANMVYLTFPLELIEDTNARKYLLDQILKMFGVTTEIENSTISQTPRDITLFNNFPNPFNPMTRIRFYMPITGQVVIDIYSITGQKIKSLLNKQMGSGNHNIIWDGTDSSGKKVSSGVYIYRLTSASYQQSKKMMLIR